jgi:hypothetical protein
MAICLFLRPELQRPMSTPQQLTFTLSLDDLAAQLRSRLSASECLALSQLLQAPTPVVDTSQLKTELTKAAQEAKLAAQGSLTLPTLDDFLNEL